MTGFYPGRNDACDLVAEREPHEPHEWDGDLGDEGYECWGYPVPDEQPERFRVPRRTR